MDPTGIRPPLSRYRSGIADLDRPAVPVNSRGVRIGVLGPLQVDERDPRLGTRDRVVLAALALRPGEVLSPEQLADAVWGESPPVTWSKNIQGCVSRLRKLLGSDAIETSVRGYRLMLFGDSIDAVEFTRAAQRAKELLTLRESEHARYVASRALALWRGRPLEDLEQWETGLVEAGRLTEVRSELEELVIEASLAAGHHGDVLAEAAAMVEAAPLRERRWALLAQAQYQAGRQMEALRTLRRVRVILHRELGLDPGPDLVALEQAILRQDPDLMVDEATPAREDVSPYLGLTPYAESDSEAFFGRESEIEACADRLRAVSLLAVVGPSGCGKSSLVRAGLAPTLRRDGADVHLLTPGRHPSDALTSARVHPQSFVLVDQAEEAFSLCSDEDERSRFFATLVEHTKRGHVVLALRADHTGDLAQHPPLAALVERGLFLLGAMSPESLRAAIESPARQHGLVLEPGLADLLIREVEGEPGALPLLSHALRETWIRRAGRTLTVAGYQTSGGIRGAVALTAERLYGNMGEAEQTQLRELALRLVVPGPQGEPVRGRVPRHQVVVAPEQERLLDQMVAARLVTSDEGVIELAHEALVRAWPRLRGWLEDDVAGQRMQHRLTQAAEDWAALDHHDSELYRGTRLTAVREWVETGHPQLSDEEQRFLQASADLAAAEEASAAELARTRGRMVRRLRVALGGASVLLVLALVTGFVAVGQTHRANRSALAADADRVGAQALVTSDVTRSLLMAIAGARLAPSSETEQNLYAALEQRTGLIDSVTVPGLNTLSRLAVSPDGATLAVADRSHRISTYDARTLDPVRTAQLGSSRPSNFETPLAFDPTGHSLAAGAAPGRHRLVTLLDPRTLRPLPHQLGGWPHRWAEVVNLAYSADGRSLAVMLTLPHGLEGDPNRVQTGRALVWNLEHPAEAPRQVSFPNEISGPVVLSPDGSMLYFAGMRAAYDVHSARWRYHHGDVGYSPGVAIDPSGHLLAGTFGNAPYPSISLVDARTGRVVRRLGGYTGDIDQVSFSPDGTELAATTNDGSALVWNVKHGFLVERVDDGAQSAPGLGWSADGRTLFTTAADSREIHAWDLTGLRGLAHEIPIRHMPSGGALWVSSRGNAVAVGYNGGPPTTLSTIDMSTRTASPPKRTRRDGSVGSAGSFSPDGRTFAAGYDSGWVQVFSQDRARPLVQRRVSGRAISQVAYTADAQGIAVLDDEGDVHLVDAATLRPRGPYIHLPATRTWGIAVGPDNRRAFVFGGPPIYRVGPAYPGEERWWMVDLVSGRILLRGRLDVEAWGAAFSPRGDRVAVAGLNGEMELLDATTGRPVHPASVGNRGDDSLVAFNSDGSRLAAVSSAGDVSLWDGRNGRLLATTTMPSQGNAAVGFRSDGSLTVIFQFGPVYQWDPNVAHAISFACRAAGRDMTRSEWEQLLPGQPYRSVCPPTG